MADYCMCHGDGCIVRDTCWRHTQKPSELRQAYFVESPGKDSYCKHYIPVEPDDRVDAMERPNGNS